MKPVLIQYASGPAIEVLNLVEAHNAARAAKHGWEYRVIRGEWDVSPSGTARSEAAWMRYQFIMDRCGEDPRGLTVIWDADVLWLADEDIYGAFGYPENPPFHIGVVRATDALLNSGAMYVWNTPDSAGVAQRCWDYRLKNELGQDGALTLDSQDKGKGLIVPIAKAWNNWAGARDVGEGRPTVVWAWHGQNHQRKLKGIATMLKNMGVSRG